LFHLLGEGIVRGIEMSAQKWGFGHDWMDSSAGRLLFAGVRRRASRIAILSQSASGAATLRVPGPVLQRIEIARRAGLC
jgi:hypothetical protein